MARPNRSPASAARLPRSIDRTDVAAIVARCRDEIAAAPDTDLGIDCRDIVDPKLTTVEVIARLALAARRNRQRLRLEHAGPDLLDLLALCGLTLPIRRGTPTATGRGGRAVRTAGRSARCRGRT